MKDTLSIETINKIVRTCAIVLGAATSAMIYSMGRVSGMRTADGIWRNKMSLQMNNLHSEENKE